MSTPKPAQSRLTQLGAILLDFDSVQAVTPIWLADGPEIQGFRVVTSGGSFDVTDTKSSEALRQAFYGNEQSVIKQQ